MLEFITSDALRVRHGFFTRKGGASSGIFSGLNCGTGSTDQAEIVGRTLSEVLRDAASIPSDPSDLDGPRNGGVSAYLNWLGQA